MRQSLRREGERQRREGARERRPRALTGSGSRGRLRGRPSRSESRSRERRRGEGLAREQGEQEEEPSQRLDREGRAWQERSEQRGGLPLERGGQELRSSGASGAGELLCSVTSGRRSESEGGCSPSGTESEGSGEGSGLANRRGEGYFFAVSGATEAKPDGACKQSEGRSKGANRAEHESQRAREQDGRPSKQTIQGAEREARASRSS